MADRAAVPERAELHFHLGSSVDPPVLWTLAHAQGIKLPTKDYWEFEERITLSANESCDSLDDMHESFFSITERIQSSPYAVEESVRCVIGGGYRKCNLVLQELRFNPMFRNRRGEQDLDHIIMAALRGMDKAMLEYPQVRAGIILMMDRMLPVEHNRVIVEKAITYRNRGVVGVDIGGPQRSNFSMAEHAPLFAMARAAGLGITVHTGEEGDPEELRYVLEHIRPDRIGHGLLAADDPKLLELIRRQGVTLESCPTSNLRLRKVSGLPELARIFRAYLAAGVSFTINTDGAEMYETNVYKEERLLIENQILTEAEVAAARTAAFTASFIRSDTTKPAR